MEISLGVIAAVLGAALLHATWNALVKSAGRDALSDMMLIAAGGTLCALLLLPFVGAPARASWHNIAWSTVIHFGYYVALANAYRTGDLSFAYPVMRGVAPLLIALLGVAVLQEQPALNTWLGIALVCCGILSIAFVQGRKIGAPAAGYAFGNAAIIAAYTLVDGAGARASDNPIAYVTWLIFIEGIPFIVAVSLVRRDTIVLYVRERWGRGLVGGACSFASYGIVLWAMTRAPVAAIAAIRETSVIFASLIGSFVLKEGLSWRRLLGAASVVAGIIALRA